MAWKHAKGGLVWYLNKLLNKNHAWAEYFDPMQGNGSGDFAPVDFEGSSIIDDLVNRYTGHGLTSAEEEANAFSAEEAEKARQHDVFMATHKYQFENQSMTEAGVNPAMVYGGGNLVPTSANGASANSVSPNPGELFDMISTIVRLPSEIQLIKEQANNIHEDSENKKVERERLREEVTYKKLVNKFFPDLTQSEIDELNSRVDLNKVNKDKSSAETDLTKAKTTLQEFENKYADEFYALRNALEDATAKRELSREQLNNVQSAMYKIEKEYMENNGMKMGSSEWYSVALALLSIFNTSPNALVDTLLQSGGELRDKLYPLFNGGDRPTLYHNPSE